MKMKIIDQIVYCVIFTAEEIHRLSGSGYTAACALNLMGLCTDNELQAIGKMLTYVMEKI